MAEVGLNPSGLAMMNCSCHRSLDHSCVNIKNIKNYKICTNHQQLVSSLSAGRLTLDKALDLTRYLQHEASIPALLKGLEYLELFYHMMERRNVSDVTENLKVCITSRKFTK